MILVNCCYSFSAFIASDFIAVNLRYRVVLSEIMKRKFFLRMLSVQVPKAKLTLSSLNRLFDRYEPIPLFRQYLHTLPPLMYAPLSHTPVLAMTPVLLTP